MPDCNSIINSILAKVETRTTQIGVLNNARQAYKSAGCEDHFFSTAECTKLKDAIHAAEAPIRKTEKQINQLHINFRQEGCEDTSNCSNAGVNFLSCVTIPESNCDTNIKYKKRCCDLDTQLVYIDNLLVTVQNRIDAIDSCFKNKTRMATKAREQFNTWNDPSGSYQYQLDQVYNAFKTSILVAIIHYNIDQPGTDNDLTNHEEGSGNNKQISVSGLPLDQSAIDKFTGLFYEQATSGRTLAAILNVSLPNPFSSGGPTVFNPPPFPECSGVTDIPTQTFHCFSVEEWNTISLGEKRMSDQIKSKFPDVRSFCRDLFRPKDSSFIGKNMPTMKRNLVAKATKVFRNVADQAFQEAIAEYEKQAEVQKNNLGYAKKYKEDLTKDRAAIVAEKAALDEEIAENATQNKNAIEQGLGEVIRSSIRETVNTTHRVPCDTQVIPQRYPFESGVFGPQMFTTTDAAGMTRFDTGPGSHVNSIYPEDKACCTARGDTSEGKTYSYPVTLNATVKIVLDDAAKEKAKKTKGIVDLTPDQQDALLNDLNGCTKTITFCLGESS